MPLCIRLAKSSARRWQWRSESGLNNEMRRCNRGRQWHVVAEIVDNAGSRIMDSTIIAAVAASIGSLVGAAATVVTTWITQRTQTARSQIEARLRDRQAVYGEFITEASRLTVDALTHQLEQPVTFVNLYGILGRIRLMAGDPVLHSAEACCHEIVDLYAKPNMTVDQIRAALENGEVDPIKKFSTVCRNELLEIAKETFP
jgi:hypothetical protein